ncbi:hypothetical protein [Candidatus Vondammii sp. HM_W22]|uniref:hypothetical protein n=1 Tax=Candidatus Vondammii sp. HM_W22 TaxID=2687299 RepID=UPI001F1444C6|nr:hypothetical protein [Candidatus Vondammii sp. HM_W22]
MLNDIQQDIVKRLSNDYEMKERGEWLQQEICPSCNKKELFTRTEQPWVIRCGREKKCGFEGHTKELYPDAFANFNQRFIAT